MSTFYKTVQALDANLRYVKIYFLNVYQCPRPLLLSLGARRLALIRVTSAQTLEIPATCSSLKKFSRSFKDRREALIKLKTNK